MPPVKKKRVVKNPKGSTSSTTKKKAKTIPAKALGTGMARKAVQKLKSAMQRRCEAAGMKWDSKKKICR